MSLLLPLLVRPPCRHFEQWSQPSPSSIPAHLHSENAALSEHGTPPTYVGHSGDTYFAGWGHPDCRWWDILPSLEPGHPVTQSRQLHCPHPLSIHVVPPCWLHQRTRSDSQIVPAGAYLPVSLQGYPALLDLLCISHDEMSGQNRCRPPRGTARKVLCLLILLHQGQWPPPSSQGKVVFLAAREEGEQSAFLLGWGHWPFSVCCYLSQHLGPPQCWLHCAQFL